ncbi:MULTISPECIES: CaiB/BaiF CoA-transferase family protein [unclassified Caballeronia]|uniref:CaiB/BaiF CoA transferase family protein n=1 Tax=unclassified Caballeronia TaxID=2646786 RepID=UPI0028652A70|nr:MULTISPECIES: CaiB/BaiF CoA-transferase family protein [unclassified Caballeronia]MDR5752394.1 CaiB/BaiF CoA-transferase family protein [Caballeronia sp. LZ024]MDR5845200.1 CaiB/BaiF CoA-transferase family protein [Caballeronia sp. LZ031]
MTALRRRGGPLAGIKVVEIAGIGPGPLAAMFLADLGATVIRVDRKEPSGLGAPRPVRFDLGLRNRKSIRVDLKDPAAVELVMELIAQSDALIEGFRPGVMERLGLGPDKCLARNPRLVYGRVTGWGQDGPLSQVAGHDLNYISITGALHAMGRVGQAPTPPLNVLGDYAGGSLYLAFGLLAGILEARSSDEGQVVDAAMVDGVASIMTVTQGLHAAGMLSKERGTNLLDTGAHFYEVYACADGRYVSVGAIESKFYDLLLEKLELRDHPQLRNQMDRRQWPKAKQILAAKFMERTRDEWARLLSDLDVCVAPVLNFEEAPSHPHIKERGTFIDLDGVIQPAPGPRFSRTPAERPEPPPALSTGNAIAALHGWLPTERIQAYRARGTFT